MKKLDIWQADVYISIIVEMRWFLVRDLSRVFKALSDMNRVRILKMLEIRPLCVCEITEVLQLATSTVSKHLSILRDTHFIIDGTKFCVQQSNIESVVRRMKAGTERVPGYMRVSMCKPATRWPIFIILSVGVYRALLQKLEQLMRSDDVMHANLRHNQALDDIRAWNLEQIKNPPKF